MKYLTETELRQLAEAGELVLWRWNGIWMCDQGAVSLPIYFALVVSSVRVFYDNAWRVSFSISDRDEFSVICSEYSVLTAALYDIGLVMSAWLEDTYFSQVINTDVWDVVRDIIAFLANNADNAEPLPERLVTAVRELEAPSALVALLKIQDWRNGE